MTIPPFDTDVYGYCITYVPIVLRVTPLQIRPIDNSALQKRLGSFSCADGAVDGVSVPSALWMVDGEALRAVDGKHLRCVNGGWCIRAFGTVDGGWLSPTGSGWWIVGSKTGRLGGC